MHPKYDTFGISAQNAYGPSNAPGGYDQGALGNAFSPKVVESRLSDTLLGRIDEIEKYLAGAVNSIVPLHHRLFGPTPEMGEIGSPDCPRASDLESQLRDRLEDLRRSAVVLMNVAEALSRRI